MYNFWSSVLLGDMSYNGSPLSKHMNLEVTTAHFDRWIELFAKNINEQFSGPVSDEAKNRAHMIAKLFQHKMGLMKPN